MVQKDLEKQLNRKLTNTEQIMYNLMSVKSEFKLEVGEGTFKFIKQ